MIVQRFSQKFQQIWECVACCAVNAEDALKKSKYADMVQEMQTSFEYSGDIKKEKESIPAAIGIKNGLRLTLDLHSNQQSFGTVPDDFSVFKVFVGDPKKFPALKERSFVLQPGHEHFMDISYQIFNSNDMRALDPIDRNCYFEDEGSLEFFDKYTYSNCKFECGIKLAKSTVNCISWYLPQEEKQLRVTPGLQGIFQKYWIRYFPTPQTVNFVCRTVRQLNPQHRFLQLRLGFNEV